MHYLIDAYNLLFCFSKKQGKLEQKRQHLIEEINREALLLKLQITLVFDGAAVPPSLATRGHFDAVEIVYTPKNQTADQYILQEVMQAPHPARLTVVSNDRELTGRCNLHKAHIKTLDAFLFFLMKKKKKKRREAKPPREFQISDGELKRLLKIFEERFLNE